MDDKLKIAIVDDHEVVRDSLGELIVKKIYSEITLCAANGIEFLSKLPQRDVDLVILDIAMPGMDGVETIKELRIRNPKLKVIVLTMYDDERLMLKLIKYKINGFLLKSTSSKELITAIKDVVKIGYYFSQSIAVAMFKKEAKISSKVAHKEKYFNPDEVDLKILALICEEKTSMQIAYEIGLSHRTIENRKKNMMKILGLKNQVGLAIYAIKTGVINI